MGSKISTSPERRSVPVWAVVVAIVALVGLVGFLIAKATVPAPPPAQSAPLPDDVRAHFQSIMGTANHAATQGQPASK